MNAHQRRKLNRWVKRTYPIGTKVVYPWSIDNPHCTVEDMSFWDSPKLLLHCGKYKFWTSYKNVRKNP